MFSQSMNARSSTWYGIAGSPRSSSVTSAFVATPSPEELRPVFASSPASTTLTKFGPSSCVASRTTTVSKQCSSQSQFWPRSV